MKSPFSQGKIPIIPWGCQRNGKKREASGVFLARCDACVYSRERPQGVEGCRKIEGKEKTPKAKKERQGSSREQEDEAGILRDKNQEIQMDE